MSANQHRGLGLFEVAHGMVAQDLADEGFHLESNVGRLRSAMGRGGHQIGQILRGEAEVYVRHPRVPSHY